MRYLVVISAEKLTWPRYCASCMGVPDTSVTITTRKISSRNLAEMSWQVPYCRPCKVRDDSAPSKLGWFKSLFDSFTKSEYAVEYLSLHLAAHKFAFNTEDYVDAFLSQNGAKNRSEVWRES